MWKGLERSERDTMPRASLALVSIKTSMRLAPRVPSRLDCNGKVTVDFLFELSGLILSNVTLKPKSDHALGLGLLYLTNVMTMS